MLPRLPLATRVYERLQCSVLAYINKVEPTKWNQQSALGYHHHHHLLANVQKRISFWHWLAQLIQNKVGEELIWIRVQFLKVLVRVKVHDTDDNVIKH